MHAKELYARVLNIEDPWRVAEVELNEQAEEVIDWLQRRPWRRWPSIMELS